MYLLPWRNAIHQTDRFLLSRSLRLWNSPACWERCFMDFMSLWVERCLRFILVLKKKKKKKKQVTSDNKRWFKNDFGGLFYDLLILTYYFQNMIT